MSAWKEVYLKHTLNVYFKYTSVEIWKIYTSRKVDFKYNLNVYFKYTFLIHSETSLMSKSILQKYFSQTPTLWLYVVMSCTRFRVNGQELFAQNRHGILSLGDRKWIQTHNHLVRKRTLNHLAKLVILDQWLSIYLQTK